MTWLLRPLNTLSLRLRWLSTLLLTCFAALLSFHLQRWLEPPFNLPDNEYYRRLASGRGASVPQPFASRPLAPLLARALGHWRHVPVELGFYWLGCGSLVLTLAVVFALAMRTAAPRWLLLAIAVTPFWTNLLHALVLPDPLSAALLCGLLLCLAANRPLWAAATLFPLMLARESTSLTLLCLLAVGWRQMRWRGCLLAVGAAVAGSGVVRMLSPHAAGNTEHLPMVVYLAAKLPWNLLRLVGIAPWSNLYPYLCTVPGWQIAMHVGSLRSLGVCSVSPAAPLLAAQALLTAFGWLPLLLFVVWRERRAGPSQKPRESQNFRSRFSSLDLLTKFCLLYGGISFALAPLIGTEYMRLYGYAWPLLFVALPRLVSAPAEPRTSTSASRGGALATGWRLLAVAGLLLLQIGIGALEIWDTRASAVAWVAVLVAAAGLLLAIPGSALPRAPKTV